MANSGASLSTGGDESAQEKLVIRHERADGCLSVLLVLGGFLGIGLGTAIMLYGDGGRRTDPATGVYLLLLGATAFVIALAKAKQGSDRRPKVTLTRLGLKDHRTDFEIEWRKVLDLRLLLETIQDRNGSPISISKAHLLVESRDRPGWETVVDLKDLDGGPKHLFQVIQDWSKEARQNQGYAAFVSSLRDTNPAPVGEPKRLRRFRMTVAHDDGNGEEIREVEGESEEEVSAFAVLSGFTVIAIQELSERKGS